MSPAAATRSWSWSSSSEAFIFINGSLGDFRPYDYYTAPPSHFSTLRNLNTKGDKCQIAFLLHTRVVVVVVPQKFPNGRTGATVFFFCLLGNKNVKRKTIWGENKEGRGDDDHRITR